MSKEQIEVREDCPPIGETLNYYSNDFWCDNCGHRSHRYIIKGLRLKHVHIRCDKCGCEVKGAA
jgi:hypothetical protein